MHNYHRVWAEVNLDAIRANMESFRDNVPKEAMLCGVIKTDVCSHRQKSTVSPKHVYWHVYHTAFRLQEC